MSITQTIILSNGQIVNVPEGADAKAFRKVQEVKLNPNPKKRTRRIRSRKTNRRTFRASQVLAKVTLSGAERQAAKRGEAMAEQVERNGERK